MSSDYLVSLANHLWQSTIVAAAVWLLTLTLRQNRASVRHRLWLAASVKFLVPFSLLTAVGSQFRWRGDSFPAPPPPIAMVVETLSRPFASSEPSLIPIDGTPSAQPGLLVAVFLAIWICGFVVSIAWWFVRWLQLRRALRRATRLSLDMPIPVMSWPQRLEPGVLGIFKPVLLLPEGIMERLSPAQLKAVLAHELCHVQRRDNLAVAIHMFVEALFWFHPLLWWIRVRLIEEQERACDEEVLRCGGDPQVYAESILRICELYLTSPLIGVSGIAGSKLKTRIGEIMRNQAAHKLSWSRTVLLAVAAFAALAGPIMSGALKAAAGPQAAPAFEVASIKPDPQQSDGFWSFPLLCQGTDGPVGVGNPEVSAAPLGRCVGRYVNLLNLIVAAYDVPQRNIWQDQSSVFNPNVSGGPDWIGSRLDTFQIEAKAEYPEAATREQLRQMLRTLLADRFKLKVRLEIKQSPGYALVLASNGPKLQKTAGSEESLKIRTGGGGAGLRGNSAPGGVNLLVTGRSSLSDFAAVLGDCRLGALLVVDRTNLVGSYDFSFRLNWIPDPLPPAVPTCRLYYDPPLDRALEDQLGLRLMSGQMLPETFVVIEHAERPSEN